MTVYMFCTDMPVQVPGWAKPYLGKGSSCRHTPAKMTCPAEVVDTKQRQFGGAQLSPGEELLVAVPRYVTDIHMLLLSN